MLNAKPKASKWEFSHQFSIPVKLTEVVDVILSSVGWEGSALAAAVNPSALPSNLGLAMDHSEAVESVSSA